MQYHHSPLADSKEKQPRRTITTMTRTVRRPRASSSGSASSASSNSSSSGRTSSKKAAASALVHSDLIGTGEMSSASSTCSTSAVDAANALTFPRKLAEMLDHEGNVVVWLKHGLSFVICDYDALANRLLPQYFRRKWGKIAGRDSRGGRREGGRACVCVGGGGVEKGSRHAWTLFVVVVVVACTYMSFSMGPIWSSCSCSSHFLLLSY